MKRNKCKIYILLMVFALLITVNGCRYDPMKGKVESVLTPVLKAVAVTDLKATVDGNSSVVLSFSGQDNAEGYGLYYELQYKTGPDYLETRKLTVVPEAGQKEFSITIGSLKAGTHVLASVTAVIPYVHNGRTVLFKSSESSAVEGAVLPKIDLLALVEGASINLSWNCNELMKELDGNSTLYPGYEFVLTRFHKGAEQEIYRGQGCSYSDVVAGNAVPVSYSLSLNTGLVDGQGNEIVIGCDDLSLCTDISYSPYQALSIKASEGTDKSEIQIRWEMDDFITGLNDVTVAHRALVERSVHGTENWETVVSQKAEINCAQYSWVPEGAGGKASYLYVDHDITSNTTYDYRITAYYLKNGTALVRQSSSISSLETENPGYAEWLPENLRIASSSITDGSVTVNLAWDFFDPSGRNAEFVLSRIDSLGTVSLDLTGSSHCDQFSLDGSADSLDSRYDHHWYYSLKMKHMDGTTSEPIVTAETVDYNTEFEMIDYVSDLDSSDILAKKAVLTWTQTLVGGTNVLDQSKLHYEIRWASDMENVGTGELIASTSDTPCLFNFQGNTVSVELLGLPDGLSKYCRVQATYGEDSQNPNYVGTVSAKVTRLQTLSVPSGLAASDGTSISSINVQFSPSQGASGYLLSYRAGGSSEPYEVVHLNDSSTILTDGIGEGTADSGRIFDFVVQAQDRLGNTTDLSNVENGCLLGPALLGVEATVEEAPGFFSVSWNSVAGADGYVLNIYRGDVVSKDRFIGSRHVASVFGKTVYDEKFSAADSLFSSSASNPYPLSEKYSVVVIPENGDSTVNADLVLPVTGCWLAPPKGIVASKAESGQQIKVTWNAVEGADSYNLYSSNDGRNWSEPVSCTTTSWLTSTAEDTWFTLETVKNGMTSLKQTFAEGDDSALGFVLRAPENLSVQSHGDKTFFTLSWSVAPYADDYLLIQNSRSGVSVGSAGLEAGASLGTEDQAGFVSLSADGKTMTCNFAGADIKYPSDFLSLFTIQSVRNVGGTVVRSTKSQGVSDSFRLLKPEEMIWVVNSLLSSYLHEADSSSAINGDWWQGSASSGSPQKTVTSSDGHAVVKNVPSVFWSGSQGDGGSIQLTAAPWGAAGFTVTNTTPVVLWVNDNSYLKTDPLGKIDKGEFVIRFPSDLFKNILAVVKITEAINVQTYGEGKLSVSFNGETVEVSAADLAVKPF